MNKAEAMRVLRCGETKLLKIIKSGAIRSSRRFNNQPLILNDDDVYNERARVIYLVENGFNREKFCQKVGIAHSTFDRFRKLGVIPEPFHIEGQRYYWSSDQVNAAEVVIKKNMRHSDGPTYAGFTKKTNIALPAPLKSELKRLAGENFVSMNHAIKEAVLAWCEQKRNEKK